VLGLRQAYLESIPQNEFGARQRLLPANGGPPRPMLAAARSEAKPGYEGAVLAPFPCPLLCTPGTPLILPLEILP